MEINTEILSGCETLPVQAGREHNEVWPSGHFVRSYWTFIVLDTN